MKLKEFYFQNIKDSEYHFRFYHSIEKSDYEFEVYDDEEAIVKFRELCLPNVDYNDENKCWFYLVTYYLYKAGYVIKEFPRILARPPIDPHDFAYDSIRNKMISLGIHDNGTVRYSARRIYVEKLIFQHTSNHPEIDDDINLKFIEISNRQASFNSMSTDEKLAEIVNLIEHLLKKDGNYITPNYSEISFDYISDNIVTSYRKKLQCFRHATDKALTERAEFSKEQKEFFIDFGITVNDTIKMYI